MDKLLLLLALALASPARGENLGAAYYGIQNPRWPCAQSLKALRSLKEPKISFLWNSFGLREACLRQFLSDPRLKVLELHLINECCIRNHNCPSYDFGHGFTVKSYEEDILTGEPAFKARLDKYLRAPALLMQEFRSERLLCLISPGLESNLSPRAGEALLQMVRPYFPGCKFVWNPLRPSRISAKFVEAHGAGYLRAPCIGSNDGKSLSAAHLRGWADCRAVFVWHGRFNGWPAHGEPNPDRRARTDWPGPAEFN